MQSAYWLVPVLVAVCAIVLGMWLQSRRSPVRAGRPRYHDRVSGALLPDALDEIADAWIKKCGDPSQASANRSRSFVASATEVLGVEHRASMLVIHVDQFSEIQAMLTVPQSERFLMEAGRRLQTVVAPLHGYCARSGHDQFRIFVPGVDASGTLALAQRVRERLNEPYVLENRPLLASFSVAAALYPEHGEHANSLARSAHVAMQAVRHTGSSGWRVFDLSTLARERLSRELEQDLRQLFADSNMTQFEVVYQPISRCSDGECVGGEALLRWNHPVRGLIPTDTLIALAERTGIIVPLGLWVLELACQQAQEWPESWRLHVNLSVGQLHSADLAERVISILTRTGLPPTRLGLELTETLFIRHYELHAETLRSLRQEGVSIVLDDFGSGYSSLNHLRSLPLDWIKLDAVFAVDLEHDLRARALVQALVTMARALDLVLVVEGVESEGQRQVLREMGCDTMQGYLLGRPMSSRDMLALCATDEIGQR